MLHCFSGGGTRRALFFSGHASSCSREYFLFLILATSLVEGRGRGIPRPRWFIAICFQFSHQYICIPFGNLAFFYTIESYLNFPPLSFAQLPTGRRWRRKWPSWRSNAGRATDFRPSKEVIVSRMHHIVMPSPVPFLRAPLLKASVVGLKATLSQSSLPTLFPRLPLASEDTQCQLGNFFLEENGRRTRIRRTGIRVFLAPFWGGGGLPLSLVPDILELEWLLFKSEAITSSIRNLIYHVSLSK